MNTRETAEAAISVLQEKGWHKGSAMGPDGSLCLASALNEGACQGAFAELYEIAYTWEQAQEHILRLFPGRMHPDFRTVADFNDHPDTTEEDIFLVLKHMAEGE